MGSREPYPPPATDAGSAPGATAAPRRRGWMRALGARLLALGLGLVLTLLLAEGLTRLLSEEGPAWTFRDSRIGRRFARSWEGKAWVEEAGRAVHLAFNREGLRDRDWPEAHSALRVAVLGDSMVAALATEQSRRFTELLQGALQRDPRLLGRFVAEAEVQNWGVAGSSPAFELLLYERAVRRYRPSVAVLCWFAGNDLSDDWGPLGGRRQAAFDLDASGALVPRALDGASSTLSEWLACHSRFYVWQRRLLARLRASGAEPDVRPGLQAFADPDSGEVARAWALQDALLRAFGAAARADGAQPLLVLLPCAEQVYDDLWERTQARARAQGLDLVRERLAPRLAQAAQAAGLAWADLTSDFRAAAPAHSLERAQEHLFLGGTGHLNDAGQRVVAAGLARALAALPWSER